MKASDLGVSTRGRVGSSCAQGVPISFLESPQFPMQVKKNERNYYRVLHVQPDAPLALIRASYRTLMQTLRNHPDLGGEDWNAAILNEAYAVLSDESERSAYDAQLFSDRPYSDTGRQTSAQRSKNTENAPDPGPGSSGWSKVAFEEHASSAQGVNPKAAGYQPAFVDSFFCAFCGSQYRGSLDEEAECATCNTPLKPLDPLNLEFSCQRHIHRVPLKATLTLHSVWPGPPRSAILRDLSPNGLNFTAEYYLKKGQKVRVACSMFTALAEITNCTATRVDQHRYGARFITIRYSRTNGTHFSASV